jgi:acetyl-CoA C-acetyltransferase
MQMTTFILSAVRTPIGKFLGGLAEFSAPQLGSIAIKEALARSGVAASLIDEVLMGQVVQAGTGQAPARQASLGAGIPDTVPAHTVNMVCGSGLKAVMLADQAIRVGDAQLVVAGGMESMSRAPFLLQGVRQGYKYGHQTTQDSLIQDGLWCSFQNWPMGEAAEHIATKHGLSRDEQDRFSVQSHHRAAQAWKEGHFTNEVVAIDAGSKKAPVKVSQDEGIRADSSLENLAKLKPAFKADGTVTAGNASQLSDGAAALVLASESAIKQHGAKPLARIVMSAMSGVHPKDIFIAPVLAIQKVCDKAGVPVEQVDLFEINEAFAAQMLACLKELRLSEERVNITGGGIALGHPIGASGARVLVTLVHALHRKQLRYGVACLCLGGGNAVATLIERVS